MKTPNDKSETASDVTNMFGIVRIRGFNITTRSVKTFPTNKNNKISMKTPVSRMTFSLLLDFSSFNMSSNCFALESSESILGHSVIAEKKEREKLRIERNKDAKGYIYYLFVLTIWSWLVVIHYLSNFIFKSPRQDVSLKYNPY